MKGDITWSNLFTRAAIIIGTVAVIIWAIPSERRSYLRIDEGKPWRYSDLTAPFDFPIYKSDKTIKKERDSLMRQYEPYYSYNTEEEGRQVRRFVSDFSDGIPGLSDDYISIIANRLRRAYRRGIMNSDDYDRLKADTSQMVRVVNGKNAVSVKVTELCSAKEAYEQLFVDELLYHPQPCLRQGA